MDSRRTASRGTVEHRQEGLEQRDHHLGRIFLQVMLPMARAGVLTLVVFQLLYTWSAYLMPLVLVQSQNLRPVSLGMIFFQGTFITDESLLAAGAAIVSLPMIISYVFLQRYFIRGIVAGALK